MIKLTNESSHVIQERRSGDFIFKSPSSGVLGELACIYQCIQHYYEIMRFDERITRDESRDSRDRSQSGL